MKIEVLEIAMTRWQAYIGIKGRKGSLINHLHLGWEWESTQLKKDIIFIIDMPKRQEKVLPNILGEQMLYVGKYLFVKNQAQRE